MLSIEKQYKIKMLLITGPYGRQMTAKKYRGYRFSVVFARTSMTTCQYLLEAPEKIDI